MESSARVRSPDTSLLNFIVNERSARELDAQRIKVAALRRELDGLLTSRDKLAAKAAADSAAGKPDTRPDAPTPTVPKNAREKADSLHDAAVEQAQDYARLYKLAADYAEKLEAQDVAGRKLTQGEELLAIAKQHLTESQYKEIEAVAGGSAAKERAALDEKEYAKNRAEMVVAFDRETASLEKQVATQREHNDVIGLTREQQDDLAASKLELTATSQDEYATALENAAAYAGPYHDAYLQAAVAVRGQAAALRDLAAAKRQGAVLEHGVETEKQIAAERTRGWEETDRLAREVFTTWATEGGNAGKKIGDTLKKALLSAIYEATLKPVAFQIYLSATNALGMTTTANGASGGASALSSANGLYSGTSGNGLVALSNLTGSSYLGLAGTGMNIGWTAAGEAAAAYSAAGMAAEGFALQLGAAIPYVGAAVAVASILGLFDDDKNPDDYYRFSGLSNHATINKAGFHGDMFDFYGAGGSTFRALPEDIESGLDKALEKLFTDMKQMAVLAGNTAVELDDLTVAVSHTGKGLEADIEAAVNTTADAIAQKLVPNIKDFQAAGESLSQTFTRLAQAAVAARLTSLSSMASGIHDIGGARLNVATSRFGIASQMRGFDALSYWGDVSAGLFNQVHAADFQTLPTATRLSVAGKLQEAIGSSYQAQVAHFAEIRDARLKALQAEQAAAEQAAAASRSAYESAAQTASAMAGALHQIADYAAKLNVSDLSTLSPEAKLAEAARQYESLLAGARGGDAAATGQLTGGADTYLQSARDYFASGADYASIFASVQSALTGVGAGAAGYDAQAASLASIAASTQGSFDMAGRQAAIDAEFNAEIKSWQENALKQYDSLDGLMGGWQGDLQSRLDEEVLSLSSISGGVDLMVTSIASMGEDIGGIVASAIERVSDAQNETLKVLVRITEAGNQANVDRLAALERRLSQIEANGTLAGGAP